MRRPGGAVIITDPSAPTHERDSITCAHCNRVVIVEHKQRAEDIGGLCKVCMGMICESCVSKGGCDPFEEKLRRFERRTDALRSYGF